MAHYVVLSFDNDEHALEFTKEMLNANEEWPNARPGPWGAEVVGLVKKPTIFCDGHPKGRRALGFIQGKKYGWWVCAGCKKPTRQWAANYKGVVSQGVNRLTTLFQKGSDTNAVPFWELKSVAQAPEASQVDLGDQGDEGRMASQTV